MDTQINAARARAIVIDIESHLPGTSKLGFIEMKSHISRAPTITVARNDILYSLNKLDDLIDTIVELTGNDSHCTHYLRQSFQHELDSGATSVNYDFAELLARAQTPR